MNQHIVNEIDLLNSIIVHEFMRRDQDNGLFDYIFHELQHICIMTTIICACIMFIALDRFIRCCCRPTPDDEEEEELFEEEDVDEEDNETPHECDIPKDTESDSSDISLESFDYTSSD